MIYPTYQAAKSSTHFRQAYLDSISYQLPHYVNGLVYDPYRRKCIERMKDFFEQGYIDEEHYRNNLMIIVNEGFIALACFTTGMLGRRIAPNIHVTDQLFDYKESAFSRIIMNHEAFHCRDAYYGIELKGMLIDYNNIKQFRKETINNILEIRAWQNVLQHFGQGLRYGKDEIRYIIEMYKDSLEKKSPISSLEEEAILAII